MTLIEALNFEIVNSATALTEKITFKKFCLFRENMFCARISITTVADEFVTLMKELDKYTCELYETSGD